MTRFATYGFSGAVLVAKGGQTLLAKGYGYADRERGITNTVNTRFGIGSVTKQFTAAAILHLEMEGKLSTTDPIGKYLGEFPGPKGLATIHHLLTHTSGLTPRELPSSPTAVRLSCSP